jgi:hypothetical protein
MKHAGPDAIAQLEPLLREVRKLDGLTEKKPGTFYKKSRAFLHFHEDPTGLYADVRLVDDADFERMRVTTAAERKAFLRRLRG